MRIVRVGLDVPLDQLFDYVADDAEGPEVGRCVQVPFGRKQSIGVILEQAREAGIPASRLKPVGRVLREAPPLPPQLLALLRFCSRYYHYPLGQTVAGALPTRLRNPRPLPREPDAAWRITGPGALADPASLPPRSIALRRVLGALRERHLLTRADATALVAHPRKALEELVRRGWAERVEAPAAPVNAAEVPETPPALNPEQAAALGAILAEGEGFNAWLLQGITGSGKTEVYLRLLEHTLAQGRQGLVLTPEINLTPQLEARFRRRFPGVMLASLHSGLAAGERLRHWLAAASGRARIVLGTRLAVFTPLPRLGLIVVDEEHDGSFKQEDGLRYSARDVAVFRAKHEGVPVVLGSATPSLESLHNAARGRYRRLVLARRAGAAAALPQVRLLDTRGEKLREGLSARLIKAIGARLGRGEQSLVFVNRRGYAPVLMCPACRWVSPCPRCAGRLVLHLRDGRLLCHHCGHGERIPVACPECGNQDLRPVGHGTQRLESALAGLFPGARIARVDRDSTRRRNAWEAIVADIRAGRVDILVGTQILAKGHDFEGVSLVGVLNSDAALYSTDFRASERLFAQLTQVAGRAGRGSVPGEVLVQTEFPDHPLYLALCRHDFDALTGDLLEERRVAGFPPFVHQALLRAEATGTEPVQAFLRKARELAAGHDPAIVLFEPVPALLPRLAGMERAQLLVQSASRARLQAFLEQWRPRLAALGERRVRWCLDVDPLEA
ncbi:MAG TPA: primosomal protein N' [Burkholderiales bacterium]|nr:primosomal protein N' [Burkholderiales bacterium]